MLLVKLRLKFKFPQKFYADLIEKLLEHAVERHAAQSRLKTEM